MATETATRYSGEKIVKTACHLCHGGCVLLAHIKNGKFIKLEGDPEGPLNQGSICEKASAATQYVYSPYRLKYPLKRVGARGEGKWKRISWDEALDTTARRLQEIKEKHGGESIAYAWGTGRVVHSVPHWNFFNAVLGTPNGIGIGHVCITKTRQPVVAITLGMVPGIARRGVFRDFDRTNCIVAWGDTLIDSRNDGMANVGRRIADALDRGAKLIVIDPVFTRAASKAHIWLPIRPGTDIALALSWLNVIISEGLYDKEFVEKWTNVPFLVRNDTRKLLRQDDVVLGGSHDNFMVWDTNANAPRAWDSGTLSYGSATTLPASTGKFVIELKGGQKVECKPVWQVLLDIVKEWTPEKTAEVTWLPASKIRESAIIYATTKPACIEWGVAMSQCTRATATNQAILHLMAITGNLDIPGGNAFWIVPAFRTSYLPLPPEQEKKRITSGYIFGRSDITPTPSAHQPAVWKAIITGNPYPIKALIGHSSNPLICHENPNGYILEALKKLDFIVWADVTMTPSNEWADILLPVTTPFERDWCGDLFDQGIFAGQAIIKPQWESRSDFDIYRELSVRLGREDTWPWKTEREYCNWRLEGLGITFEELTKTCFFPAVEIWKKYDKGMLRKDGKPGFPTASGKVEIYASRLEEFGLEPLPTFSYPPESYETTPNLAEDFPLILITGSRELNFVYFHSQYHYVPWLREMQPYPVVLINPETANKLSIEDGAWAWIETRKGRARFKAQVTPRIHPKVVSCCHGWWYPELPGPLHGAFESNINLVVDPFGATDPASGTTELRGLLCKVYRADGPPTGVIG